jgi:hypothetical protein
MYICDRKTIVSSLEFTTQIVKNRFDKNILKEVLNTHAGLTESHENGQSGVTDADNRGQSGV